MEQSTSGEEEEEEELNYSKFTEKEIEVSQILLDLESIILKSELRDCWPLEWGTKKSLIWGATKKRSCLIIDSSGPPTSSLQKPSKNDLKVQVKDEATSPSTPLAFSPSESDDKFKHRKNSKKRSREELLETVKELTENKIALQGELEKVKIHYNGVLAYNKELKAAMKIQKESTMICHKKEKDQEPQMDSINQSYNLGLSLGHGYQLSLVPPIVAHHHQHQPSMADPRARESFHQYTYAQVNNNPPLFSSANNGLGRRSQVGPINSSILDINVSAIAAAEESSYRVDSFQPLDYNRTVRAADHQRAIYAEARRERQMKMKFKQIRK